MSGLSSFVFFVYVLRGSTNQRPPKFPGLSTFAKKIISGLSSGQSLKAPPPVFFAKK